MKILQNPFVTGALAIAAVVVVLIQVMPHRPGARSIPKPDIVKIANALAPGLVPPVQPPPPPKPVETPKNLAALLPELPFDQSYVRAHYDGWVTTTPRDPFLLFGAPKEEKPVAETNSPLRHMKLKGIWEQTGSRIAVINRRVYAEGDEIEGYKVIKITGDEVWFQGPLRKERLGFEKRQPTLSVATNTPPVEHKP
jgi:hypothetical protein